MSREKGTILYGMMGSGKTTLGEGLATHLGQPFQDTDEMIVAASFTPIKTLIDAGAFPDAQEKVITRYRPRRPEVVATGGSVAVYPKLVKHLAQFGVGIFLNVDPEALETRLSKERIAALNNPDGLPFKDLYARRAQLYIAAADLVLDIAPEETAKQSLANLIELRSSK